MLPFGMWLGLRAQGLGPNSGARRAQLRATLPPLPSQLA
jgi:hypothetical protein